MAYPQTLGRYRLLQRIARGGQGEVWSAHGVDAPTPLVAVKTLLSPDEADAGALAKFIAEAKIGAAVSNHVNIVRTIDLGREDDRIYLVMELLEGRTFAQLLKGEPLPFAMVASVGLQVLAALEHARTAKGPTGEALALVHRDLKPSNLFLTHDGVVKVIDFGIALAMGMDVTTTRTGVIRGSTSYVSPEQAKGERPDARSDLFSLAAVLHELLTGRRLFNQETDAARLSAILFGSVPPVRSLRPETPAALDEAVLWALKREPADRPQTAQAFADALKKSIEPDAPWSTHELAEWLRGLVPLGGAPAGTASLPSIGGELASPRGFETVEPAGIWPAQKTATGEAITELPPSMPSRRPAITVIDTGLHAAAAARKRVGIAAWVVLGALAGLAVLIAWALTTQDPDRSKPLSAVDPPSIPVTVPRPVTPPPVVVVPVQPPAPEPEPVKPPEHEEPLVPRPVAPPHAVNHPKPPEPKPAVTHVAAPVHVTIDSRPGWANVSIDGKEFGPTPLVRLPLAVGVHQLSATSSDGRHKTSKLKLVEGKDEKILLEW